MAAITRRALLKGLAATGGAALSWRLLGSAPAFADAASASPGGLQRRSRVLFGGYAGPVDGKGLYESLLDFEGLLNGGSGKRVVKVYRFYRKWQDPIDCTLTRQLDARGTRLYVSPHAWRGVGGTQPMRWRDIAEGAEDAEIVRMANECKAFKRRIYFSFHHEPEDDTQMCGTAADFVAAYERIMDIFESQGVRNVKHVVTLMAATYNGTYGGGPEQWMPRRPGYQIGVDGYNRGPCFGRGDWISFTAAFAKAHSFSVANGRKLFIAECGSVEGTSCGGAYDATAKAAWFDDALAVMKGWGNLQAFCYSQVGDTYPFRIDTSTSALAAFRRLSEDPYFRH